MSNLYFLCIIPASDRVDMNALAAACFGGDAEFICAASASGTGSPSHYVAAGWWNPDYLDNIETGHWTQNSAPTPGYSWKKDKSHNKPGLDGMAAARGKPQPHGSTKLNSIMARMKCVVGSPLPEDPQFDFALSQDTAMLCLNEFAGLQVIQGEA